jgi:hypothetical protein
VDQLLKKAERTGSREQVLNDIVRLGEGYSIVTPYTSFLVLENDGEYKRWQIERRNSLRTAQDRNAKANRQEQLELIKKKAVADIGPQDPSQIKDPDKINDPVKLTSKTPATNTQNTMPANLPYRPAPERRQSRDFNFGGGPVGPLFAGVALWLRRRKMNN